MKHIINKSESCDPADDWVSITVIAGDHTFQVWIDKHGGSVAIEGPDKSWKPTGVSFDWGNLQACPVEEAKLVLRKESANDCTK